MAVVSAVWIASPVFYAIGRNRVPVVISIIAVLVNAALNIMLVRVMGYTGLALGTSIAALFNATALFVVLRRSVGGLNERRLAASAVRIVVASLAMGATAYAVNRWLPPLLPSAALVWQIVSLTLAIAAALLIGSPRECAVGIAMLASGLPFYFFFGRSARAGA